MNDFISGLL